MNTLLIFGYNTIIKISILEAKSKSKQTTHLAIQNWNTS